MAEKLYIKLVSQRKIPISQMCQSPDNCIDRIFSTLNPKAKSDKIEVSNFEETFESHNVTDRHSIVNFDQIFR